MNGPRGGIRVTPGPVITREDFAALVADLRAELDAAGPAARKELESGARAPEALAGRPWAAALVLLRDAAALAGYSHWTFKAYAEPRGREARRGGDFPRPAYSNGGKDWRYRLADIAVWCAGKDARQKGGIRLGDPNPGWRPAPGREPPPPSVAVLAAPRNNLAREAQAVAFTAALVTARPALTAAQARDEAARAGMHMQRGRATRARIMDAARARALPAILGRLAPGPDGMVPLREVARVFGVSMEHVRAAVKAGRIRAVKAGMSYRIDPSRLRYRAQNATQAALGSARLPVPVDRDHPGAVPLPGDKISEEEDQP